ncbi:MAG: family ATPase [Bacillota bacterium]|jgi:arginine utilization regulatory protein|nr:family ATPase [Bacillota bacterium]
MHGGGYFMIETYYDIITKIENFFDGIMIVDENCIIKYNKNFSPGFSFNEKESIGKTPMEVWPNLTKEESTCYRAVTYGETTTNKIQILKYVNGQEFTSVDNTFPIIENGKIIGAISTTRMIDEYPFKKTIDLPNMTTTYTDDLYNLNDIIGSSKSIELLKYEIHKVSQTNSSVLIYGETGTGKELVAQSIHSLSTRKGKVFISQNCAAIPHTLLESIFFGTTKGSYTGAENKAGIFELADGGTIFLDEINSMDLNMQAKLLKAIEEKRITRIGGSETKKIDVRIIAALNEDPQDCINNNKIRKDLFYRISSIQISVPPLRERKSDIEKLTEHYIKYYNREMNKQIKGVTDEVLNILNNYDWPGNVREFKNAIECGMNFASSILITKEDLPDIVQKKYKYNNNMDNDLNSLKEYDVNTLNEAVESFEKQFIINKAKHANSLSNLADDLCISRQTLNYKVKKYGIDFDSLNRN